MSRMTFWIGYQAGEVAAKQHFLEDRDSDYEHFHTVEVWPKDRASLPADSPWLFPDLAKGCCVLVLNDQNRLFLVRPVRDVPGADLPLVILPWDQVDSMKESPRKMDCP
jgi:hypothetical protein